VDNVLLAGIEGLLVFLLGFVDFGLPSIPSFIVSSLVRTRISTKSSFDKSIFSALALISS